MSWTLGPTHPDYGKAVDYGSKPTPRRPPYHPHEQRHCARSGCPTIFTVKSSNPGQTYCSGSCRSRAMWERRYAEIEATLS